MTNPPPSTKQSYKKTILNHMLAGQSISTMQAYDLYNITCFLQRVSELRAAGIPIKDEMVKRNGKRFKQYWIDKPSRFNIDGVTK